jgi:hypothetical protein
MTPTNRSLQLLRKEGKVAECVERWNAFARTRKDLFGFIDVVALDPESNATWAIQCTTTGNLSARVRKIIGECRENARKWIECGGRIEILGWAKRGPRGGRKRWVPSRREITLADLDHTPAGRN